ncbi:hypothetical protein GUJ93_ZPchr0006g46355 [Zizania palustris]|uniref:Calmodulin-binding domain-containing protein n=1 Tax=Zizania palustris TaxID=103762 RepID=A0A8J5T7Z2_ZIZPA|nr:hypothetical protein GUJ93_ZPchr0006g46355 [Zizania palustris]KAG8074784.1 hypothetical protein GUJ93_ZPchr0006g46355 [Zizania palustris]
MATRPSTRSRDGARPRSTSGRPPSSPRSSDSSRQPARSSFTASSVSDKPVPSFLRPTVSSSLHSSASSSSLSSSSKGPSATSRRSTDKSPSGPPRPITPKAKVPAATAASSSSSSSRWSAVSPRQLIQRASNAIKASSKSRAKKDKDAATPATSTVGKEVTTSAAGKEVASGSAGPTRAQSVEEHHHQSPEAPAESSPAAMQEEAATAEPKAEQDKLQEATSQDVAATVEEKGQEEPVGVGTEETKGGEEEVVIQEDAAAVKTEAPEAEEKQTQPRDAAESETVLQKNPDDEPTHVAIVKEASQESTTPNGQQDKAESSMVEETAMEEEIKVEEGQQEEALKSDENKANSESSVISEDPKEEEPVVTEAQEEVSVVVKMAVEPSISSEPSTPLDEARHDVETVQASPSESTTPVNEAINQKAAIDTLLPTSEPSTPVKEAAKEEGTSMETDSDKLKLTFKGSKVKTAMEKRSEEEQPKKKDVARSNDVIEETKSKLLEKRKSKVKALVGAFETVMDTSPGKSS